MAIVVRATCNHVYSLCLVACRNATGVVVSVAHYAFEICRENSVTTNLELLFHSIAPAVRQREGSSARSRRKVILIRGLVIDPLDEAASTSAEEVLYS